MTAGILLPAGLHVFERGWLSSNSVLLLGSESSALIDTGYATHAVQTVGLVRSALGGRRLDLILNTHLHSDHCGGNAALQSAYPGVATRIPPGLAPFVRDWNPVKLTYVPTGQICPRFSFDGVLSPGSVQRLAGLDWEIHSAPGHDPHSVILWEPETRVLLSADALWENGFGVVFQELEGERAFDEVAATLDMIESLAPRWVVPGHGSAFADVAAALARARSRLQAYVADPRRHASHASKVLLKFKLLDVQSVDLEDFLSWASGTAYFQLARQRWFPSVPMREWLVQLATDLVRSGAARIDGHRFHNA